MKVLALVGISAALAWLGLPLLHWAARGREGDRPASRFRALVLAYVLGAALFAVPLARALAENPRPAGKAAAVDSLIPVAQESVRVAVEAATPPLAWVGAAWALVALVGLARLALSAARAARLARAEAPVPPAADAIAERLARELGIAPPRLVVSGRASLPFVRGLPATVVLPAALLESMDDDALELVLRHELTHLARLDHLFALALSLLEVPFTFHPSARRLAEEIGLAREMAVDVRVGAVAPRAYAHLLVDVVELHRFGPREAGEVALDSRSLERRIEMLANAHSHRAARFWPTLLLALVLGGAAVAAPVPPDGEQEVKEQPVVNVAVNGFETIMFDTRLARVSIGSPEIVNVAVVSTHEVGLEGTKPGRTTLLVWTEDGKRHVYLVVVK
ncbi:MAG: M56 family metallopeptidase [Myxococcales bacterium]|jgi:beta-lactamase regulating signal transducer with metallopeptidase domain